MLANSGCTIRARHTSLEPPLPASLDMVLTNSVPTHERTASRDVILGRILPRAPRYPVGDPILSVCLYTCTDSTTYRNEIGYSRKYPGRLNTENRIGKLTKFVVPVPGSSYHKQIAVLVDGPQAGSHRQALGNVSAPLLYLCQ